jgi:hypothetical protein
MKKKGKKVTYKGFCVYFKDVSFNEFLKMLPEERFKKVQLAAWKVGRELY